MNAERYSPSAILQPFVKTYMIIESDGSMVNRVLPDTSIVMAFVCRGKVSHENNNEIKELQSAMLTGIRKTSRLINYAQNTSVLLVIFKDAGAAAFIKEPLHMLYSESTPLDNFVKRQSLQDIQEQLGEAGNNTEKIRIVERFLIDRLRDVPAETILNEAVKRIQFAKGAIKIKDVIRDLPVSVDAFEKKFRHMVGVGPKQFAGIVRLRSIIDNYSPDSSLTSAAYEGGYFDQSHFIKDFKAFTGQSPKDFFKSPLHW
ncbi:helix-turn-helix domain-containing protein [Chitinophagaceae bacterium 26-R-25]|nr:helix-turn-helix domain-containing protein [Chitinophagaceae bacterium 26-R-25]